MCRGCQNETKLNPVRLSPHQLIPRRCSQGWTSTLWTPLEYLLVITTIGLGCGAILSSSTSFDIPAPGVTAAGFQGMLVILHGFFEGPRLQIHLLYVPAVLTAVWAGLGWSTGSVHGVLTLALSSISLILSRLISPESLCSHPPLPILVKPVQQWCIEVARGVSAYRVASSVVGSFVLECIAETEEGRRGRVRLEGVLSASVGDGVELARRKKQLLREGLPRTAKRNAFSLCCLDRVPRCRLLPKLLPVDGRGPFRVAIATEHIRTPVATGIGSGGGDGETEFGPLELMAQVYYPVEMSSMAQLPWFPHSLRRFRQSLVPAKGAALRVPFALTQASVAGAILVIVAAGFGASDSTVLSPDGLRSCPSVASIVNSGHSWAILGATALFLTCLVSDVLTGVGRSPYRARYMETGQAKSVVGFVNAPGWLGSHFGAFDGPGFDAGHYLGQDLPCFPVAQPASGEGKRPVVFFCHGLGGNRAIYSQHAAEFASYGYVAIFLEHNDGSGSSCVFPDGKQTKYKRPPDFGDFTSERNKVFRLAQLRRRARELKLAHSHLSRLEKGLPTDLEACRRLGLGSVIDAERPALIGHSFGSATILQLLSDDAAAGSARGYSAAILLDTWAYPLSDEARTFGIDIPVIFVTTDSFVKSGGNRGGVPFLEKATQTVRDGVNDLALDIRIKEAGHQDFSDTAFFAPGVMRRIGATEVVDCIAFGDQVKRLMLCALEVFLRRSGGPGGDADHRSPLAEPSELADLTRVLLGTDLAGMFPQARVERVCSGGILPSRDFVSGASLS